jgi:DNA polymerase-3 subunit alpha
VGEAGVECIIDERRKYGFFKNIFEFIKRINQRTVNKKTLESLAYAGGFDCFPEHHRAQYFNVMADDPVNGLEKVIRYGQVIQNQQATSTNTLFGDLPVTMEIVPPRLADCPPWPLIVQLDHEKEVTGMFLSGHPLDHHKFEMKHYGITPLADFNEYKEVIAKQPNPSRLFRLLGLVAEAQHRVSKQGNKYGNFIFEDYSGKTDIVLWSEDYLRFSPILEPGRTVFLTGYFKQRYNRPEYEFKVSGVSLAETLKKNLTKQVHIEIHPKEVTQEMLGFVEKNMKDHPGKAGLKITLAEPKNNLKISLLTKEHGFEMNDEMAEYLEARPEFEVQVTSS